MKNRVLGIEMRRTVQAIKIQGNILIKVLPILAFSISFLILYFIYPNSFEATWKGRTYYVFFLWLLSLETMLSWDKLYVKKIKLKSIGTLLLLVMLLLPTIYVIITNYFGLNVVIAELSKRNGITGWYGDMMPLSVEYLIFATLFILMILFTYGIAGVKNHLISSVFLATIGMIYLIDNLYPYGKFTPFQMIVPATAMLAAKILNLMGYETTISFITNDPTYGSMPYLVVKDAKGFPVGFGIAWPCSGVESLIIYTVTILLFLKSTAIPKMHQILYFAIGAIVTYLINILRIVTIYLVAIDYGMNSPEVWRFHDYYGQLYSITWIIAYPFLIIGSRVLWDKIKNRKTETDYLGNSSDSKIGPINTFDSLRS